MRSGDCPSDPRLKYFGLPMRPSVSTFFSVLALMTVLGCPLDIQVRPEEAPDAGCEEEPCEQPCASDAECPDDARCYDFEERCVPGPRLTEACSGFNSCQPYANCKDNRCELRCNFGCPLGYRCGPEALCVETCTGGARPERLGDFCNSSLDCTRCGFCVEAEGGKRCHQPCQSDSECPEGAPGSCQQVPGKEGLRVCRLS
ncbi:latent transforming growth factor beta-binding protein [Pyxidicoccus sp. 3LG]